jgi:hypothetical protein
MDVKAASLLWNISERRVQKLCKEGRIENIRRFGHSWMIPKTAKKPEDMRRKYQKVIEIKKGGDRNV